VHAVQNDKCSNIDITLQYIVNDEGLAALKFGNQISKEIDWQKKVQ